MSDEVEKLEAFIKRAGFDYGWENLEAWARRMAEEAVKELSILHAEIERKDGHIKYALRVDDHSMVPMNKMVRRRIEAALSTEEVSDE